MRIQSKRMCWMNSMLRAQEVKRRRKRKKKMISWQISYMDVPCQIHLLSAIFFHMVHRQVSNDCNVETDFSLEGYKNRFVFSGMYFMLISLILTPHIILLLSSCSNFICLFIYFVMKVWKNTFVDNGHIDNEEIIARS